MLRTPRSLAVFVTLASCATTPADSSVTAAPTTTPASVPVSTSPMPPPRPELAGYTAVTAANQRAIEAQLDALVDPTNLDAWMKRMTERPHHVGSPHDRANVEFMAEQFRQWGYDTEIVQYDVLFPTPKERRLELLGKHRFRAKLREPKLASDAVSQLEQERLPPYNVYGADGDVTAPLVYVNYGVQQDYDDLARLGIDVTGKIVIARYGRAWRGIKPKLAAAHGAIGCIIYSDPADDGYARGLTYPDGAFRHAESVQRGSVYDLPQRVGDPLTPFAPSLPGVTRLSREQAETLPSIPVLPISWSDAQPLLEALAGPVAPSHWGGALPMTYRVGPSHNPVHMVVRSNWDIRPAYNVVAKLTGSEWPEQWILRGNHHDAWVAGASDPVSGLVAMMEEARVIGTLAQRGQRPRRTIVYAAWGAEEPGIIGSTEWVEQHAVTLSRNAAIYINSDASGRGFLSMGGSHALTGIVNEAAASVADPQTTMTIADRRRAKLAASDRASDQALADADELPLSALGSGSDYSPFLQHLGVASLNLGFGGESDGGSYHSVFDSYEHYTQFGDPGFAYGATLAKVVGRITLRAANGDVLPFRFGALADTISGYVDELDELVSDRRERAARLTALLDSGRAAAAADPTAPTVLPPRPSPVPELSLASLRQASQALARAAARFDRAVDTLLATAELDATSRARIDAAMLSSERLLTDAAGLPTRPWYRHLIYAPGLLTGYGVKTMPGVREAIEAEDWALAAEQAQRVATAIDSLARSLDDTAATLSAHAAH